MRVYTFQASADQRWRPASRKLSFTISQASRTISSLVAGGGTVAELPNSRSSSSIQDADESEGEEDGREPADKERISTDEQSNATDKGEWKRRPKESTPERAPISVLSTKLTELLKLFFW